MNTAAIVTYGEWRSSNRLRCAGALRISAKPSPIRTITVGLGFAPNLSRRVRLTRLD